MARLGLEFGPTHWNVRADVRDVADRVCRRFNVTWNTYQDHPPGFGLDATSVDFWGPGGRGDQLHLRRLRRLSRFVLLMDERPPVRWMIRERRIYVPPDGWSVFRNYQPTADDGHLHVTFW